MIDGFSSYPVLTNTMVHLSGYVSDLPVFSYIDGYEEFLLKAESADPFGPRMTARIIDPRCTWAPETHNLKICRKCRFSSAYCLFGDGGICALTATLGIALNWIATQCDERGIIPFGELTCSDSSLEFELSASFDKGKLKGSLKLQTVLYLKDAGAPEQSELYFAQQPGSLLGTLDSYEVYVDGNGSVFPISVTNELGKPLWSVYYNESADVFQDRFYLSLKIESSMVESPLFTEVLASALLVIVESVKEAADEEWENVLIGESHETGSIAEAIYFFVSKLGWDVSSPSALSLSIRKFLESNG